MAVKEFKDDLDNGKSNESDNDSRANKWIAKYLCEEYNDWRAESGEHNPVSHWQITIP